MVKPGILPGKHLQFARSIENKMISCFQAQKLQAIPHFLKMEINTAKSYF